MTKRRQHIDILAHDWQQPAGETHQAVSSGPQKSSIRSHCRDGPCLVCQTESVGPRKLSVSKREGQQHLSQLPSQACRLGFVDLC